MKFLNNKTPKEWLIIARYNNEYAKRANLIYETLKSVWFTVKKPQWSIYIFPQFDWYSSEKYVSNLILKKWISAIPGKFFWAKHDNKIRFCFGSLTEKEIVEIWKRLS